MMRSSVFLLALGSAAALSHLPAAHVHRRARAAVMQFEEETTDRRAVRLAEPSAQPPPAAPSEDDGADVQRGVRVVGFGVGTVVGNLILGFIEALSSGEVLDRQQQIIVGDDSLYKAVLPLIEDGTIPTLTPDKLPSFLGGDKIRDINKQANDKYLKLFSAPEAPTELPPQTAPPDLTGATPAAPDLISAAQDAAGSAGSSALEQIASTLSLLPQPASAAGLPAELASPAELLPSSALDSVGVVLAGDLGLGWHIVVPIVCGALGTLGFELLSLLDDEVGAAVKKVGRVADLAGQKVWALVPLGK